MPDARVSIPGLAKRQQQTDQSKEHNSRTRDERKRETKRATSLNRCIDGRHLGVQEMANQQVNRKETGPKTY